MYINFEIIFLKQLYKLYKISEIATKVDLLHFLISIILIKFINIDNMFF